MSRKMTGTRGGGGSLRGSVWPGPPHSPAHFQDRARLFKIAQWHMGKLRGPPAKLCLKYWAEGQPGCPEFFARRAEAADSRPGGMRVKI